MLHIANGKCFFFGQQEAMERQTKLQEEQAAMAESLKNMQKKINEEKSI